MGIISIIKFGLLSSLPGAAAVKPELRSVGVASIITSKRKSSEFCFGQEFLLPNLSFVVRAPSLGNFDIHVHSLDNNLKATIHENPPTLIGYLLYNSVVFVE